MFARAAIAIDKVDWPRIEETVKKLSKPRFRWDKPNEPQITEQSTIDNTYMCIYWDWVEWEDFEVNDLIKALDGFRHSMIIVDRSDGTCRAYVKTWDERGTDEEFTEMLTPETTISFYTEDNVLAEGGACQGISRERALDMFKSYVIADAEAAEPDYVYDALCMAGCEEDEIRALGFGYVIPKEKEV